MEQYTRRRYLANTAWIISQGIYSMIMSFVVSALSARYLGPTNYGLISYGAAFVNIFAGVSQLGLTPIAMNECVRNPDKTGAYLGTTIVLRFVAAILSCVLIDIIVHVLKPNEPLLRVIVFAQSISLIINIYEVLNIWNTIHLKSKYISISKMLAVTLAGVWRISLLINKSSVVLFAMSGSIQALVCAVVIVYIFLKQRKHLRLSFSVAVGKYMLGKSWHQIVTAIGISIYMQMDRIMLGQYIDQAAVGVYSAASTLAYLWEFLPTAMITSATPVIQTLKMENEEEYQHKLKVLIAVVNYIGIIVLVVFVFLGKPLIYLLYGDEYIAAFSSMLVLLASTSFALVGTVRSIWIVAEDLNKYTKYYIGMGTIVNLALNALLIPIYGILGAAVATLISQIFVAIISPIAFKKTKVFVKYYFASFREVNGVVEFVRSRFKRT